MPAKATTKASAKPRKAAPKKAAKKSARKSAKKAVAKAAAPKASRKAAPKKMAKAPAADGSRLVAERIQAAGGWRAATLAEARRLIREADPEVVEEIKWVKASNPLGVPVWSHEGILCTGESYKDAVKLTFMRGASLADPEGLFNTGFAGGTRRAIDLHEGDRLDPAAFKALVREAVEANLGARGPPA